MKTYNDIYLDTRKALREAGVEGFDLEARLLTALAANKTKEEFLRDMNLYTAKEYEDRVQAFLERRLAGEPIAYVTGEWEFFGLPMLVSHDVLIPRIDTEVLVEKTIDELKTRTARRVLDLCSGSGCIGIAIAANVPDSKIVMVDNSVEAMGIARKNVAKNNVQRQVTCVNCDALKTPPVLLGRFDVIVSNPPYIPTEDILSLDPSVRDQEPKEALDGGEDGLTFYRAIAEKWKAVLKDGGKIFFEVGIGQAQEVRAIMEKAGFEDVTITRDTMEIERVVCGTIHTEETFDLEY